MSLSKEQILLLNLIKKSLNPELQIDEELFQGIDWKVLVRESRVQSVMYQCFDVCKEYKGYIPSDVYAVWENASMLVLNSNFSVFNDQANLVSLLGGVYSYIILKGQSNY